MKWYKQQPKNIKLKIREVFELATGQKLSDMIKLFTFSECMDLLYDKLVIDGFNINP